MIAIAKKCRTLMQDWSLRIEFPIIGLSVWVEHVRSERNLLEHLLPNATLIGDPKFGWSFGFKEFARPAVSKEVSISPLNLMGPVFFLAFSMFGFVLKLGSLATEKELKLHYRKYEY